MTAPTDTGWPDPQRPGVPLNPEESRPHWCEDGTREKVIRRWSAEGYWASGNGPPERFALHHRYVGPCLTPAEVAAALAAARAKGLRAAAEMIKCGCPGADEVAAIATAHGSNSAARWNACGHSTCLAIDYAAILAAAQRAEAGDAD